MIVKVIRSYNYPNFYRQSPNKSGQWEGIQFTTEDIKQYDLLICLNPPAKPITTHLPLERRWLITQEPPVTFYHWHKKAFKYFGKVFTQQELNNHKRVISTQSYLPWHVTKNYDELVALKSDMIKSDTISTITSSYTRHPGQKKRVAFLEYLMNSGVELKRFGKGIQFIEDKFDGIAPYKYSIAIENSFYPHCWTEKLIDCFLSWTMPIYQGDPTITSYFPADSMILIDLEDFKKSKNIIETAIQNKKWEKNIEAIGKARNLILNQYQFFPAMVNAIQHANLTILNTPLTLGRQDNIPSFLPPYYKFNQTKIKMKKYFINLIKPKKRK